jgi:hypothetical protein
MASVVEAAREALRPLGVCLPGSLTVALNADLQRDSVRRLDHVGYRTAWVNETIGKDAFVQLGVVLAETQRMVVGTMDPDPTVVRDSAHEHLLAGADHVTILPSLGGDFRDGIDQLER